VDPLVRLLGLLLIGVVAGWIAARLTRGAGLGVVGNTVIGVVGALVGGHVLGFLGLAWGGWIGDLATAVVGAVLLLVVVSVLKRA
jgi:uncharacterized membrane protein YeaQ/YmgE (transglycosylase-associated protein family)